MSSVDDRLRQAFATPDEEWVRRGPAAHRELRARHRRHQVVRISIVGALTAAAVVVALNVVDGNGSTRTIQPADPSPTSTSTTPPVGTPLEGRWTSGPMDGSDVRAAARAAGAPHMAAAMLTELPQAPFRVVVVVRGAGISTYMRGAGGRLVDLDQEAIAVKGDLVTVRPFTVSAETVHRWTMSGDTLALEFRSTTEEENDAGVPGEAWQRLLYDTATFTR